jgi:hypothetical protein
MNVSSWKDVASQGIAVLGIIWVAVVLLNQWGQIKRENIRASVARYRIDMTRKASQDPEPAWPQGQPQDDTLVQTRVDEQGRVRKLPRDVSPGGRRH